MLPTISMPVNTAHAQTPARTINGFEVSGRFLEVWSAQGNERNSVYVNGLPITSRRSEISVDDGKAYDTQWFERTRYEAHPGAAKPYDVLLGRLGANRVEGRNKIDSATGKVANPGDEPFVGIDKPADLSATKLWFPETRHTLSSKLLEYWNLYGGLSQFGFPLSEPFFEVSQADGKAYVVQYFERNRMELHLEKPAPYDVELGLLGVEQYRATAIASDTLPIAPSKDVNSTKDVITIGMQLEPDNLIFGSGQVTWRIRSLIEDQLVGRDDNDNLFPLDAWYVPTLENGGAYFVGSGDDRHLTVKYKLRRGIKWSDGVELTSNDAIFAYKLFMNPNAPVDHSEYQKLQNVDNPDRYTVIYNYRSYKQAADFLNGLNFNNRANYSFLQFFTEQHKPVVSRQYSEIGLIYPEHVLGKIDPERIGNSSVAGKPIGTGPYKVEKWTKRQEMVLVPNEHYSLTAKPLVKKIVLKFISNPIQLLAEVKAGSLDMVTGEGLNVSVYPVDVKDFAVHGLLVASRPSTNWEHLDFRFAFGPFKEHAVREAIINAINRQRIVDNVYQGMGRVLNAPVPSGVYYSLEDPDFARNYPDIAAKYKLPVYPYDPERAKKLLDDAGWKVGPDGIRVKDGEKLSFVYGTTIVRVRQQIQALVVADLKSVGIEAVPKAHSPVFPDPPYDPIHDGTYKLNEFSWIGSRDSDFSMWRCDEIWDPHTGAGFNSQVYCNPKLDAADTKFNSEVDTTLQLSAAAEAQVILMQDIAVVPLYQRPNVEIVPDKLANYKLHSSYTNSSFWNARQWYFR
jgi:peptide/nickel transport system substrate-binding protein